VRKNNAQAFTLIELLCVCSILLVAFVSCRHFFALYQQMALQAATTKMVALCHYLGQTARAKSIKTSLELRGAQEYCWHDGVAFKTDRLPPGITWGGCNALCFVWDTTGAKTPGSFSLKAAAGTGMRISMPRSIVGLVRARPC